MRLRDSEPEREGHREGEGEREREGEKSHGEGKSMCAEGNLKGRRKGT